MTEAEFIATVLRNPVNAAILSRLPQLEAPDAWIASGALFQTVWNVLTHRAPDYGIKDYDVFYFDPATSWDAENDVIAAGQTHIRRCGRRHRGSQSGARASLV